MNTHLPILNYHGIEKKRGEYTWSQGESVYVVSTGDFYDQLDYLVAQGFESVSLKDLKNPKQLLSSDTRRVMLTFDDGLSSHFDYVLNALKLRSLTGTFFITPSFVGTSGYLTWDQIKDMVEEGAEIGSHGLSHIPLPALNDVRLKEEVSVSKKMLEDKLGISIESFSVPRGFYHPRIQKFVHSEGYSFLFTSRFDTNHADMDLKCLNRIAITNATQLETFKDWVHGNLGMKRELEKLKSFVRESVPPKIYDFAASVKRTLGGGL